jgi:cyclophilin family peptidyl-prolyl cis-trans isomerase
LEDVVKSLRLAIIILILALPRPHCAEAQNNPRVLLQTNFGDIVIELLPADAPITVDNFLAYVNSGFYDGLLFHRVVEDFMIQGGAFYLIGTTYYYWPPIYPQIINESYNGLKNLRGTIAMARSDEPNSANSQFFINHVDNDFLDKENAFDGFGYCVFGNVVSDMNVVDAIATTTVYGVDDTFTHFPYNPTADIINAEVLPCDSPECADFSTDGNVNFTDYQLFYSHWLDSDCNSQNNFCNGADLNYDTFTDAADLIIFIDHWLYTDPNQ